MRTALYVRVSSDRQDVDLSVAAQLKALREYAAKTTMRWCANSLMRQRAGVRPIDRNFDR